MPLADLDPAWAWAPYLPDSETPWTPRLAAHLYRRAGFAATTEELRQAVEMSPQAAAAQLLSRWEPAEFRSEVDLLAESIIATGKTENLPAWWVHRLLTSPHPVLEKMTLFWHGHFATSAARVEDPRLMHRQNELLRRYALGDFSALVQEISRDPAMLLWLDSATNRKAHPNENYAREVMELFCLGEGNYTETDIRELARCFTGWEVRSNRYRFNRFQHDPGEKTILGETGPFQGEDGLRIILNQPACPRFVVRKLVHLLLIDEPSIPDRLIEPLARKLREREFQIAPVVEHILGSRLFYSPEVLGRKIRSPVEFAVGTLRALEGSTNSYELAGALGDLGQRLFYPPNVKGWDGGRSWINSSTLLARANLMRRLLDHETTRFAGGNLGDLLQRERLERGGDIVDWMEERLLAIPVPAEIRQHLVRQIDSSQGSNREQRLREALFLLTTQPEYQLA